MTTVRRINVSKIEGDGANNSSTDEIRPNGEMALYVGDNNKLELLIADGIRTNVKNKVLNKGTFYGGDADSGDGLNRDTIKLVPDEELRREGSDQYLVIDPTFGEPGHIHVRAGGTIDQSSADLFLGGELNNVRISDLGDYVKISTDAGGEGATHSWIFNSSGDLELPGSSNGRVADDEPGIVIYTNNGFAIQANVGGDTVHNWIFGSDGTLALPGSTTIGDTVSVSAAGTIITVPLNAAGDTEDYVGGASVLEIPKDADTNQVQAGWIITFSNNVQRTVSGVFDGGSYWSVQYSEANPGLGSSTYPLTIQSADYVAGSDGNLTMSITGRDGLNVNFTFGADGNLSLPSNLTIASLGNFAPAVGTYAVQAPDELLGLISTGNTGSTQLGWTANAFAPSPIAAIGFNVGSSGTVDILTGDYTNTVNTWTFRDNGELVFPSGGNVTFDSSAVSVIDGITNIVATGNITADYFAGDGSQLTNLAVPTGIAEGTTQVSIDNVEGFGNLVTVSVSGGQSAYRFNEYGQLTFGGINGNVVGKLGTTFGLAAIENVDINIETSQTVNDVSISSFWTFRANGNLILPAGGQILDSTGNIYTGGSSYGNTQVAAYLLTYTGNILAGNVRTVSGGHVELGGSTSYLKQTGSNAYVSLGTHVSLIPDTANWAGNGVLIGGNGFIVGPNGSRNMQLNYNNTNGLVGMPRISLYGSETTAIVQSGTSGTGNIGAPASRFNTFYGSSVDVTGNITAQNFTGNINITGNVTGTSANVTLVAGSYSTVFDNTGVATFPGEARAVTLVSTNSIGNEGGEIQLAASPNANIGGVIIDSYNNQVRIFENGGSSKGVYIDLADAPASVAGQLGYKASGFVNAGTFVTLDNIKATVTSSANYGLSLATVAGTITVNLSGFYNASGGNGGGAFNSGTLTTSASTSQFNWNFSAEGDTSTYILTDKTNGRAYRITLMIGAGYNNNMISIERLA